MASVEHQLIEFIKSEAGNQYIGDDCAILPGGLLASCDTLVEGVHFTLPEHSFEDLGFKSLAVNLSDIAAMAGVPEFVLLNISMPADFSPHNFKRLFRSMLDFAESYHVKIVGGDITRGPNLHISVTVLGKKNPRGNWLRSAATAGDVIIATGDFGASAAGLWALLHNEGSYKYCIARHKRPKPRVAEALELAATTMRCGALIDASDGLADALTQISLSSNVGMEIKESLVPMHEEMLAAAHKAQVQPINWALYGGEDYELLGCISSSDWAILSAGKEASKSNFKKIGVVIPNSGVFVEKSTGERLPIDTSKTFQHLRQ